MAWFKKERKPLVSSAEPSRVPEGLWVKCPSCNQILYEKDLIKNMRVCNSCSYHFRMNAVQRLSSLFDEGHWKEYDHNLESTDPLKFEDKKPYQERLKFGQSATGLRDAAISGVGTLKGIKLSIVAMEYGFIGGSMGSVVGEKISQAIDRATKDMLPLIIITASGGAMRGMTDSEKMKITPERALKHPTWTMGPKITIDSATLMNKAFEVIEAKWLFAVDWDQIEVVIHPESMIHSMVEFNDGSVKAQISPPDMKLPIQYALLYPDRVFNEDLARFNPVRLGSLNFESVDFNQYPCFSVGLEYGSKVGTSPAVLCGADEMAVESFLNGTISFYDIPTVIKEALQASNNEDAKTPQEYLNAANWGRSKVKEIINHK